MKMTLLLFTLVALTGGFARATPNSQTTCDELFVNTPAFNFRQISLSGDRCWVTASPAKSKNLTYRSYLFSEDGMFMIFNSYEGGGVAQPVSGARVFYFFPRQQRPSLIANEKLITIQSSAQNVDFIFSPVEVGIVSYTAGQIIEDPAVNPQNKGGIELQNHNGLSLDVGFSLSKDPRERQLNFSIFKDSQGRTCPVRNDQIFTYLNDDVQFAFTDEQLKIQLNNICPNLKFDF